MSAPINNAASPSRSDQANIAPSPTAAPPQTMASLEQATTPAVAPPQTVAGFFPVTPTSEKPAVKDGHTAAPGIPKTETVITHETIVIPTPFERHTGATPAPQIAPVSVAIPPVPSTTTIITVPPSPEHITVAPAVAPVLAVVPGSQLPPSGHPQSVKAEPSKAGEPANHPVERVDTLADLQSHTAPRSRRNSASDHSATTKPKPAGLGIPSGRAASSGDLRSGQPSPMIPTGAVEVLVASVHLHHNASSPAHQNADPLSLIDMFAGKNKKRFSIHRHLLVTKVPYFHHLFSHDTTPGANRLTFEDLDEYAFALFVRWLYGGQLHGPNDFHSFQHHLSLYVLALRFNIESLQNESIDLCRAYYHYNSMTAPAYRIEYIYTYTSEPNHMRNFLVATAAYRSLCEAPSAPGVYLSDSMKTLLAKQGDLGVDFADSLIKLSKNGLVDVRKGDACIFHTHSDGKTCQPVGLEPYQDA